jgi:hypothetical protein
MRRIFRAKATAVHILSFFVCSILSFQLNKCYVRNAFLFIFHGKERHMSLRHSAKWPQASGEFAYLSSLVLVLQANLHV